MIKIFSLYPEHFNNNGDQGNVEVLTSELRSAGTDCQMTDTIEGADFVLLGDASIAAMEHYSSELKALWPALEKRFESGEPTLLVGSCYEFYAEKLGIELSRISRVSGFVSNDYFGYRNTDLDLPPVTRSGLFIATSLYGPFLAKNPTLLRELLSKFGVETDLNPERVNWISKIRAASGD